MRALPSQQRYAALPWLVVTMTVVALAIGTIAARYLEIPPGVLWKLAAAWVLVWLPMLAFVVWSSSRLKSESARTQEVRAHAETAEANYRQLVEQARDIIYRTDAQGRFTFVNLTTSHLTGYPEEQLLGRRFIELIRPDAREAAERFYGRQFVRKTPTTYYEFPAIAKDGREVWFGQNVQVLLENGRVVGFHAVARDITERKRAEKALAVSEKRLRTILEAEPECVKVTTEDGVLLDMNAAGLAMIEADTLDQVRGRSICPIIAPPYRDAFLDLTRRAYRGEPGTMGFEIVGLRGTRRWLETHAVPLRDEHNVTTAVLAITRDVTARKQAEERLARINECFLGFGVDPEKNINRVTALCGELLGAACALYNYLDGQMLRTVGQWQAPPGFNPVDRAVGHICHDVIQQGGNQPLTVRRLQETAYAQTDPNVLPYKLQTYIGMPVKCQGTAIGSLCAVFQRDYEPSEADTRLLGILAAAIGVEEERRLAGDALRESERRFRTIFDQAPLGIAVIDSTTGQFRRINRKYCDIVGYTHKDMLAHTFQDITHPDDLQADLDNMKRLTAGQTNTFRMEKRYIRKDGAIVWVNLTCVSLWWDYETERRFHIAMVEDITDRKHNEEHQHRLLMELAQAKEHFETIFHTTPAAVGISTIHEGRLINVNDAFARLTGYSREDMIGRTTLELNLWADPSERARIMQQIQRQGFLRNQEGRLRTKSGETRDLIVSVERIQVGPTACLVYIAHDITERKRAESFLAGEKQVLEMISSGETLPTVLESIARLMEEQRPGTLCSILLFDKSRKTLHHGAAPSLPPVYVQAVDGLTIGPVAGSCGTAAFLEKTVIVSDISSDPLWDGYRELALRHGLRACWSIPIFSSDRLVLGTFALYHRVPHSPTDEDLRLVERFCHLAGIAIERTHAEEVLRNANQALRTLSRQLLQVQEDDRRAIARDLHDEIGQSLTAIKLNVERAKRASERAARDRIMQDCSQITDNVLEQVRNLSLDLHPSILDDLGLAYALKWYADRQAERAGLNIEVTSDASLPRLSHDIEIGCFRIAQEALTNVVRHAKARRVNITLQQGTTTVELRVRDDGIGFVVDAISPVSGGEASVGLASMHERARLLGGRVKIESAPGQGTTVTALLPLPAALSEDTPRGKVSRR